MNNNDHPFNFDVNFGFGDESVFSDIDMQYSSIIPPPPDEGFLLFLNGPIFSLLSGKSLTLL